MTFPLPYPAPHTRARRHGRPERYGAVAGGKAPCAATGRLPGGDDLRRLPCARASTGEVVYRGPGAIELRECPVLFGTDIPSVLNRVIAAGLSFNSRKLLFPGCLCLSRCLERLVAYRNRG